MLFLVGLVIGMILGWGTACLLMSNKIYNLELERVKEDEKQAEQEV